LGFELMVNFRRPYAARSIQEFWRRWHISLSTWFRDYVYIPLGGSRGSAWRTAANIMIVFLLSGLWHGANWTFVVWGALHGAAVTVGMATARLRARLRCAAHLDRWPRAARAGSIFVTFALVCLGWAFFRSRTLADALVMLNH